MRNFFKEMGKIMKFILTIFQEMLQGNFSFLILVVGIAQLIVMIKKK